MSSTVTAKTPADTSVTRVKSQFLGKKLSDQEFYQFCRENGHLKIERTSNQEIIIMPPSVSRIGRINGKLFGYLFQWNEKQKLGVLFDSSSGFTLPNSAIRSPDVSWIQKERWQQLPEKDKDRFAPIAPDFVAEILSKWDDETDGEAKMEEYMENGVRLGWLINADEYRVKFFRSNGEKAVLEGKDIVLDGEDVLEGFELNLNQILEA